MKACFKCGRTLPLEAFYRHPQMGDGHLGKCKDCTRLDVRINYRKTKPARAQYERERNHRPERRAAKRRYERLHGERHPERKRARAAVARALRSGRLHRRPCEVCGDTKSEAHHPDYALPLKVRWLCLPHHRQIEGRAA